MNLHESISDEFSEEGQQTSHHCHEKSKKVAASPLEGRGGYRQAGSSLPYGDWPGQTAGSIKELAIGLVVMFILSASHWLLQTRVSPRVS